MYVSQYMAVCVPRMSRSGQKLAFHFLSGLLFSIFMATRDLIPIQSQCTSRWPLVTAFFAPLATRKIFRVVAKKINWNKLFDFYTKLVKMVRWFYSVIYLFLTADIVIFNIELFMWFTFSLKLMLHLFLNAIFNFISKNKGILITFLTTKHSFFTYLYITYLYNYDRT